MSTERLILSEKYKAFLRCNAPVEFLEGTTAAGKTTVGLFKFMCKVAESPKKLHILAAKDTGTAEKNIINKDLGIVDDFGILTEYNGNGTKDDKIPHILFHTNKGDKVIYVMGYGDKKKWQKALGGQYGCLYIDEINTADIDFVREASMRCDYLMATLNPDDPTLDVYKEYINSSRPLPEWEQYTPQEIKDGAYKISVDTDLSQYPILEWYPGEHIEIVLNRGRLKEIIFKKVYMDGKRQYVLNEHYGYGYIDPHLYRGETEVPLNTLDETADMRTVTFDKSVILAVPLKVYESSQFEGRGGSIFDGKLDAFDAFDETWSQWMDALRAGRTRTYIPESYIPRDPNGGGFMKPNAFDNRFIVGDNNMDENGKNQILSIQPSIAHDSYLASYCTSLDLCLQGIISPSTLGIDVKKLDNADAQREKEKTTLYTRDAIIEALQETLPELISAAINAYHLLHNETLEEVEVNIKFKEYANPSFESQVETVSKAKQGGIMSIERCVEELYGDSLDEHCKEEEIARLKAEQGIQDMEEPAVNMAAGDFRADVTGDRRRTG